MESKRKTLTGKDVMDALEEMEFPQFIEPLKKSLEGIITGYFTQQCWCSSWFH